MSDYIPAVSADPGFDQSNKIVNYTLDQANEALDVVEDWMDWATFGVGGPALKELKGPFGPFFILRYIV